MNELAVALKSDRQREAEVLETMLARIEVRLESLTRLQGESAEIAGKLAADLSSVREIVAQHRAYLADDQKPLS